MAGSPKSVHDAANWLPLVLPPAPLELTGPVKVWREDIEILTFAPEPPSLAPMFLERRVYQGSSGKVYPLPFYDRIATEPALRRWKAIHMENEYLRIMILPEIGGRIHVGQDKRNGYDFFYRQDVIRPALVGLAGPWISGGVEFNWPQHHRPATFMPTSTEVEHHEDGSATVWCSDLDPMQRMRGTHGVCLRPGCARLDLKVRLYNRTPYTQTFLWWANVATRVHEQYQSFFPADVAYVADHAKRAITTFPLSDRPYYGVDYPARARDGVPRAEVPPDFVPDGSYAANDLSWYANIPVPTSYMVTGTEEDFFGGYDHRAAAGVVHVANHHIVPGKKQWTWGNHEFGYAWDRSLTIQNGPYIELMAGAYTDNQPDFSFLAPWETKAFMQSWYPVSEIGVPQAANLDAALHLSRAGSAVKLAVQVTRDLPGATVRLLAGARELKQWEMDLSVQQPFLAEMETSADGTVVSAEVCVRDEVVLRFDPDAVSSAEPPVAATEPDVPAAIASVEELYLTGLHLSQYRHATRDPEPYWREALARDPLHSASSNALGLLHLSRGEFDAAQACFARAIARLTARNPNPRDGEAFYNLGITERFRGDSKRAYDALYKATWNAAWRGPAYFALAEIDCVRSDWNAALDHLDRCLLAENWNLNARNLRAFSLRQLGRQTEADAEHRAIRTLDAMDLETRWRSNPRALNGQELLDLCFDLLRAGRANEAERALRSVESDPHDGTWPMLQFTLAFTAELQGKSGAGERELAEAAPLDYCFPSRLEEQIVLQHALRAAPQSASAPYLLGLLWYDRRRYTEAVAMWKRSAERRPEYSMVWRNLGIAALNVENDESKAMADFDRTVQVDPASARFRYERDQLWKRCAVSSESRLEELRAHLEQVAQRDDLSTELATLFNNTGDPERALHILTSRDFQPWEGGEGLVLGQYLRACTLLARKALVAGHPEEALRSLAAAAHPPRNLSEAKHLLANGSRLDYWLGTAYEMLGDLDAARSCWLRAALQKNDFQNMAVMSISTMTYWTGIASVQLGEQEEARQIFASMLERSRTLESEEPRIDYFATSLPAMLLFHEDLATRNRMEALLLRAQALYGLAHMEGRDHHAAKQVLEELLQTDPNSPDALDLLEDMNSPLVVPSC